jgi:predicted ABC-type ATPase
MPELVIVGGPNGSGKTTLTSFLIKHKRIKTAIINPDEIALRLFGGYRFHVKAARVALEARHSAITQKKDFAFETTFSGNSEIRDILAAKSAGYKTILYYVTLESIIDNIIRVKERTDTAGHAVPREDLVRRYEKSRINLIKNIALFDQVYLYDNSWAMRSRVAIFVSGKLLWLNPKHKNHSFYKELLASNNSTSATGLNK